MVRFTAWEYRRSEPVAYTLTSVRGPMAESALMWQWGVPLASARLCGQRSPPKAHLIDRSERERRPAWIAARLCQKIGCPPNRVNSTPPLEWPL